MAGLKWYNSRVSLEIVLAYDNHIKETVFVGQTYNVKYIHLGKDHSTEDKSNYLIPNNAPEAVINANRESDLGYARATHSITCSHLDFTCRKATRLAVPTKFPYLAKIG